MQRLYYGWYIVAITALVLTLVVGTTFSAFGLFVVPVSQEFGLSRADTHMAMILCNLGGALSGPFLGSLVDRISVKRALQIGAVLLGGCLATLGLSHSLWLSAAVMLFLPVAIQGAGSLTTAVLIARWFRVHRGRAMALGLLGMAGASMIMPPILGNLIEHEGWRATLVITGAAATVILLVLFLFVRDGPRPGETETGLFADATQAVAPPHVEDKPKSVAELLRNPAFWTIVLSSSAVLGANTSVAISLAPLALGVGLSLPEATFLLSALGAGAVAGKLLIAAIADRISRVSLLVGMFIGVALLNVIPFLGVDFLFLLTLAFCYGVGGAMMPVFYALLADRFGPASYGTVQGLVVPVIATLSTVCLRFAGEVFDRTGGYELMFVVFAAMQGLAAVVMLATHFLPQASVRLAEA